MNNSQRKHSIKKLPCMVLCALLLTLPHLVQMIAILPTFAHHWSYRIFGYESTASYPRVFMAISREELRSRKVLWSLLRQVRVEAGLRQVDVAAKLGVPQSYVSNYESGERRLDILELRNLCDALGITLPNFAKRLERQLRG